MIKNITCIVCPKGCRIAVDTENAGNISGYSCPKGLEYAKNELLHPMRTVTSTVGLTGAEYPRLPVKTDRDIPREMIFNCMKLVHETTVAAPIACGKVIIANLLGTGANLVATRDA